MPKKDGIKLTKSRLTAVAVQLEGNDETVQEGLRTLSHALGNLIQQPRLLLAKPGEQLLAAPDEDQGADEPGITADAGGPQPDEIGNEGRRPRSVKAPEVVEIDLTTGSMPLEEFCRQKGVRDDDPDSKRYIVVMVWLKEQRGIAAANPNHIYTCYRHMNWHTPRDPAQPLRDMKRKNGWINKAEGKGNYSINHLGENEVRKMPQNPL
jgi:hypothetical protein